LAEPKPIKTRRNVKTITQLGSPKWQVVKQKMLLEQVFCLHFAGGQHADHQWINFLPTIAGGL